MNTHENEAHARKYGGSKELLRTYTYCTATARQFIGSGRRRLSPLQGLVRRDGFQRVAGALERGSRVVDCRVTVVQALVYR